MSRAAATLRRLERQAARLSALDTYAQQERERLEAMDDEHLLRRLARLAHEWEWTGDLIEGPPAENYAVAEVDALIDAGDLDGAWAFLWPHVDRLISREEAMTA